MKIVLPELPYAHDALAPHMSSETLELHHGKHHNSYVEKANGLLKECDVNAESLEELVLEASKLNQALFDNVAQHYNHLHFWNWMKPDGGGSLPGALAKKIRQDFGDEESFKEAFTRTGAGQFGSGWCWLVLRGGRLDCMATPNAENPLVHDAVPILGCDVWEHSYYLDYRNERPKYLKAFLDELVNWEYAAELFSRHG